ncbi:MAG: hypothetical protein JJ863_05615 [Deltaproteobacteria bacterium]|nr:hypothetical protein [Deltaproteobacteria bacterium]
MLRDADGTPMNTEGQELVETLARIEEALDALVTRGLRAVGPDDRTALESYEAEIRAMGATHLADALAELLTAVREGDRAGSVVLLRTQVRLRLLERLLTLRLVEAELRTVTEPAALDAGPAPKAPPLPTEDAAFLGRLAEAIETLLQSGLSAASKASVDALKVSFEEASRRRLLRLGSTLRIASEEVARFTRQDASFSPDRLSFFLGRAWVLARGMEAALADQDADGWARLTSGPETVPMKELALVVVGVFKRHVPGAFAAFELRCRVTEDAKPLKRGDAISWSFVFPLREDQKVPPEAMLMLEQKQKFRPNELLEGKVVRVGGQVAISQGDPRRLMLGPKATVAIDAEPFTEWLELTRWEPGATLAKITGHQPDPLSLPIELQDEAMLLRWSMEELVEGEKHTTAALQVQLDDAEVPLTFELRAPIGDSGSPLRKALDEARKQDPRPPLFGFLHFEHGKLVLEPLSLLGDERPTMIALDPKNVDKAALVRAMTFD